VTDRADIVVFGATGASGRQIAQYLARRVSGAHAPTLRLAIAGRDVSRLTAVQQSLGDHVRILHADANDSASIAHMVASARVVVAAASPYVSHGEATLAECARAGVDYVDICGEPAHVRRMIDRHHAVAVASGSKLVPMCGFDSVPSDLGAQLLVEHFRAKGTTVREMRGLFRCSGSYNNGTIESARALWKRPGDIEAMRDPFLLNADAPDARTRARHADPESAELDPDVQRWVAPFWMAPINTRVVRRSASLAAQRDESYGEHFRYQEYWDPGGTFQAATALSAAWGWSAWHAMARVPGMANALSTTLSPAVASAASMMQRTDGWRALFIGVGTDGSRAWARLSGDGDPANDATATMVGESALALALDRTRLPGGEARGGLLTPADALGSILRERLIRAGIRVECPQHPSFTLLRAPAT
jgi:short subunit dehydrogenase-like uncharacterized protein